MGDLEDFTRLYGDETDEGKFVHKKRQKARSGWYVYGYKTGKLYIVKVSDEEDGQRVNWSKYDGNAEVKELPTIDLSAATQMIKAEMLKQGKTLEEATRRAQHQKEK